MIIQFLEDLLYEHNCVIMPGFGGFIANRLPSKVNEIQQRVEPARKVVAFNINLVQNDGLLASHISKSKQISFDEANREIREFVSSIKSEIELKRQYSLKGIGDFYLNSEDKLVFIPEADINFSKETFGLFPITIRKIEYEQENLKKEEKENKRSIPIPLNQNTSPRSRKWIYGSILITLPLFLGFFSQQSGLLQKADFNINSIFQKNHPVIEIKTGETPVVEPTKEEVKTEAQPKVETEAIPEKPTETVNPVSPIPANNSAASSVVHYHIIGGSFAVPTNAENFIKQLKDKGYNAYQAGITTNGLSMISYAGFSTESEALLFLQKIHQTENVQAWLLNK